MANKIGFQDGITGYIEWLRKQPGVQKRGPSFNPADVNTYPWPDKLERTLRMLKDEHDAKIDPVPTPTPTPTPTPKPDPVPTVRMAPQTINPEGASDARYCTTGLPFDSGSQRFYEPSNSNIKYNKDGLCDGGRTKRVIPGLRGAKSTDGANICGYTYNGHTYPPWPADSYLP